MSDQKSSQAQQTPPAAEAIFPFMGLFDDQLKRWESLQKELAKVEQKNLEQARTMIDESARLMKETVEYSAKLSQEWRRLALESTRRATASASVKA